MSVQGSHRHAHIIIILLSLVLGAVLATGYYYWPALSGARAEAQERNVAVAGGGGVSALQNDFARVAERVLPAVVNISAERVTELDPQIKAFRDMFKDSPFFGPWFRERGGGGKGEGDEDLYKQRARSLGSGFVFDADGYIITNRHVIRGAEDVKVKFPNMNGSEEKEYPAKIIGSDARTELAVVKIEPERKLPTLKLGDSDKVKIGQWAIAVGNPFQLNGTLTVGVISARGRYIPGESDYIMVRDLIQTDAAINPGNSGGPLVNIQGEVIGINVAIKTSGPFPANAGIGFAIPANDAKQIVPELIKHGIVKRGWLGIHIADLTAETRDYYGVKQGVLVESVQEGRPAARAKPVPLQAEDVIVAFNGKPVHDSWELQKEVGRTKPNSTASVDIVRDKKKMRLTVKVGELPAKYASGEPAQGAKTAVAEELGIKVRQITEELREQRPSISRDQGVVVVGVDPLSDAANKIARDDVIIKVNDRTITKVAEYQAAIKEDIGKPYVILRVERKLPSGDIVVRTVAVKR